MLPNWLYGKSKSKLAELLGGGGAPSDYNQVKAQVTQNTEDITNLDNALDTKAALTQIANPNLLDNPWFTVNQRGDTSYTGNGAYTVDRWLLKKTASAGTLSVIDGGITISASDGANKGVFICQYFEESFIKRLNGKAVTMSVLKGDGKILKGTIASFDYQTSVQFVNTSGIVLDYEVYNSKYDFRILNFSSNDITIRAVKLELGSVSTLAMDTAPNYALELAKCQRYFQRIGLAQYVNIGSGMVKTTTVATCVINIQPLRKNLVREEGGVSLHGTVYIWNGTHFDGEGDQSASLNGYAIGKDGYGTIDFNSNGLTVSSPAIFQFRDADSYIDLSADL